ncbi:MAG: penicillin-binding protein 1A [Rubrimonas sp.]|uniref:penicillin-binding protein 1A n=1 Tax=Rubrimonas sp. TaxID=2036015 RepID=UPI002FDE3AE3
MRLIAGIFSLGALIVIAAIGGVGLVVWMYDRDLPSHDSLAAYAPATLSRVYSGEGELIAEFARERRIFTPIDEIPDLVKQAFISAEDKNFYSHPGVDVTGVARAMVANLQALRSGGGRLQGASTITQQVMKNFLLSSDYSVERKIKEAILSIRIEQALSKDQILELYLNEIFLGQNAYGVAAAAQRYFGKTLEDLSLAEAAYLAALPKAPSDLHPVRQRDRAEGRRNYVLREMFENGRIDEAAMRAAQAEPLRTTLDEALSPQVARPSRPDHFTEEVRRRLTAQIGEEALFGGGLTVRATIDPRLQEAAAEALRARLLDWESSAPWRGPVARVEALDPARFAEALREVEAARDIPGWRLAVALDVGARAARLGFEDGAEGELALAGAGRFGRAAGALDRILAPGDVVHVALEGGVWALRQSPELQGAFVAMEVATGRVLALQGGFSYENSVFNRATQALRQPGSAFKPFVYAAALDMGYPPNTTVLDAPVVVDSGGETWKPKNSSGRFYGPAPMRLGLELSRNLMTVRLAQAVGMETVADYARDFGVYRHMPPLLSYALGAGETTLYDLTAAYAMFANGGRRVTPTLVDRVQDRRGVTIYRHDARACPGCDDPSRPPAPRAEAEQVVDPVTARQIVSMLEGVTSRGTAAAPFAGVAFPVAGKTGTTNDAKDVWFVAVTPKIAAGCFIGMDEPTPLGRGAFGGTLCAPVVAQFLRAAHADGRDPGAFDRPDMAFVQQIDRFSGRPVDAGGIAEIFRVGQSPWDMPMIAGDGGLAIAATDLFPLATEENFEGAPPGALAETPAPGAGPQRRLPAISGDLGAPGGLY